jgi:ketosteroid isomerase-like protein
VTNAVPDVINRYFRAADQRDYDALLACFTDDAAVTDEGRTIHGHDEIRAWREKTAAAFEYTVEVLRAEKADAGGYLVVTRLEGNFPGSPVELNFRFLLRDALISELTIAP